MSRKARKALMRPYEPTRAERALAAALLEETAEGLGEAPPHDVAFLVADVPTELGGCEKVVWFASSAADAKPWERPVARLVLGVREAAASADVSPHKWARNRIMTTSALTELERAVVKVAAGKVARVVPDAKTRLKQKTKRVETSSSESSSSTSDKSSTSDALNLPRYDANPWFEFAMRRGVRESRAALPAAIARVKRDETRENDASLFAWANAFVSSRREGLDAARVARAARDRQVVAMLVSADGALLDCAVNTNARNQALHAEVNLLAPWLEGLVTPEGAEVEGADAEDASEEDEDKRNENENETPRLPAGARVLVTLQCCRMCAALICAASDDARARHGVETLRDVVYAEEDVGKYSDDTALQRRGWEREWRSGREEGDDELVTSW
jgi:tRNA(Arg) A34 adenosine deaminase TadA